MWRPEIFRGVDPRRSSRYRSAATIVAVELSGRTSCAASEVMEAKALTLLPAQELLEKGFALLSFRFLRLTIPIGALAIGSSTGKTFSSGRLVGNLSADGENREKAPSRCENHSHIRGNTSCPSITAPKGKSAWRLIERPSV